MRNLSQCSDAYADEVGLLIGILFKVFQRAMSGHDPKEHQSRGSGLSVNMFK